MNRTRLRQFIEAEAGVLTRTLGFYLSRAGLTISAEELLSEVVVEALKHEERFNPARPPRAWLLGIGANLIRRKQAELARLDNPTILAQVTNTPTPTPMPSEVPGSVLILPPTVVSPDSIQTQNAMLSTSLPSCTGVNSDVLSIYAEPERVGRVIIEVPAGSVLDVSAYSDEHDGRWYVVGYWAATGVYIAGMAAPDTLTLSEACADVGSVVTYTPTPSFPPRLTATPTPAA